MPALASSQPHEPPRPDPVGSEIEKPRLPELSLPTESDALWPVGGRLPPQVPGPADRTNPARVSELSGEHRVSQTLQGVGRMKRGRVCPSLTQHNSSPGCGGSQRRRGCLPSSALAVTHPP